MREGKAGTKRTMEESKDEKRERTLLSAAILRLTMTSVFDKRDGREGGNEMSRQQK